MFIFEHQRVYAYIKWKRNNVYVIHPPALEFMNLDDMTRPTKD
jgi:hypothetical protein